MAVTASATPAEVAACLATCLAAGMDAHLEKPLRAWELRNALATVLARSLHPVAAAWPPALGPGPPDSHCGVAIGGTGVAMDRMMKLCLWVLPGLLLLGLALYAAWSGWTSVGETEMSWHGIAALLLGGFFTLALTALLVGLLLFSRRNGYDQ